ncbi:hypothetical protein SCLCIDRAFT_1093626 [Scleroderma citrinum Foug A]|uniref:Uncharacterized protein n=1 Tax=Scleroderma citrinum Foug A TaxID=1036808 RepID=A0A0C3DC87_9AGAM|nr:hypothetical protein SCLCIDRAFT_1093626 [Scleroderma citrinum Foug A]
MPAITHALTHCFEWSKSISSDWHCQYADSICDTRLEDTGIREVPRSGREEIMRFRGACQLCVIAPSTSEGSAGINMPPTPRRAAAHDLFYIHMSRSGLGVALSACPGVSGKVHDITGCRPSSQVVLRIHSSIPTIRRQLTPGMAATCFLQESESKWEHPYFPLPNICGMLTSRPYRLVCTRLSCDRGCAF